MKISWSKNAWDEYTHWQQTDKQIIKRINTLIKEIMRSPFTGIGKPEALKFDLTGYWSRRINDEHRLVYEILGSKSHFEILILQCRYHY